MATRLETLTAKYKDFIINTPDRAAQVESFIKIFSYIIPARLNNSAILSELLYSTSNLLVLVNDAIIRQATDIALHSEPHVKLASWYSVLECVEVFFEMAVDHAFGPSMRWIIIVCIQIAKSAIRLMLLVKYKSGIQCSPLILPLDRQMAINSSKAKESQMVNDLLQSAGISPQNTSITLTRSKRTMRTLASAPPLDARDWKVSSNSEDNNQSRRPSVLSTTQTVAESLHVTRPLIHLASMYLYGTSSWKPWLVAGACDISSLCLLGDSKKLNAKERGELHRRTLLLLLYILRSPFYDRVSKTKVLFLLNLLAKEVPLVGLILRPLIQYLPIWQRMYFYVWMV